MSITAKDKNVIIIGAGDTGADCVATALRENCKSIQPLFINYWSNLMMLYPKATTATIIEICNNCAPFFSSYFLYLLTVTGLREVIINAIPHQMKLAVSAGIGLFITFVGLQSSGIIIKSDSTLVKLFVRLTSYRFHD
ncbi:hypothetical protein ACWEH1_15070 [Micromonospora chersina]